MAIRIEKKKSLACVEVICEADDAVDHEKSDWDGYRKTGDRTKLAFVAGKEPTVFVCNFELSGKEAASVKNNMLAGRDDDGAPKLALGSWGLQVTKVTLKDIQNPADLTADERLVMKKDDRGYVHDDLLGTLERAGVVSEIFALYSALALAPARANAKN